MESNCIHCGEYFTAIRSSKKYCSDNCKQMAYFKRNGLELTKDIETLEEKHFIKEEMPKETYERFRVKYAKEFDKIRKEMATCGISISNLKEMINEAVILCLNLRQLWEDGGIAMKEGLQNLIFPSGLVYDKKNGAFRTSEINFIIAQIARHTGDLALIKKGLSSLFEPKSLSAES
ncbi:MAG: recombinase family protein [Segetibacter sp.]|nr:recombinase family protein [Bacteroidota bacterium]MCW3111549.1 recombinase family protein [Segetibacter sp.]